MTEPTTKRAREAITADNALEDIQELKRRHDELFREISRRLDYVSDDCAYKELIENKDFDFLRFSDVGRDRVAELLQYAFLQTGHMLAQKHWGDKSSGPLDQSSPLLKKLNTAFALRAAFLNASLRPVDGSSSAFEYYPALPNLELFEKVTPVILRQDDKSFWESCLHLSAERKVCGVGAPGIGKTTTAFHLLKMILMEKMKTLVYAVQEPFPKKTVYMKFVPVAKDGTVVDITVSCVESDKGPNSAHEWCNGDYYVVDPGVTKLSCDPNFNNRVHVILVCSCDDSHWGKNEFIKLRSRGGSLVNIALGAADLTDAFMRSTELDRDEGSGRTLGGGFVYCSSWTLKDVVDGKRLLGIGDLTDATICSRYRVTGGSVRRIIDFTLETHVQKMENALSVLSDHTIHELADGRCNNAFDVAAPESALVSVEPDKNNPYKYHSVICSEFAEEMVAQKHLKLSWYAVLDEDNSFNRGHLFESFVRSKLSGTVELKMDRDSSPAAPPKGSKDKKKNYTQSSTVIKFSKRTIVRVTNLAESVRNASSDMLFYSRDEFEPLIDMICRYDRGFLAIQVTIRKRRDAETAKIRALLDALALSDNDKLVIVYAVPWNRLEHFETTPVNPLLGQQDLAEKVEIHHVGIKD